MLGSERKKNKGASQCVRLWGCKGAESHNVVDPGELRNVVSPGNIQEILIYGASHIPGKKTLNAGGEEKEEQGRSFSKVPRITCRLAELSAYILKYSSNIFWP